VSPAARLRRILVFSAPASVLAAFLLSVALVRLDSPPPTFLLYDRDGRFLAEIGADGQAGHGYWPLETLPPRVVAATLALEDRRFWSHPGVDVLAVGRALRQNLNSGQRVSGASTLAMQVARSPGPRTYWRKAWEAWLALALTARYGREAVLRHYLRSIPYGNQAHGIAYAARRYFDKPVADLSWAEIALLAAIPQAPTRMNPQRSAGLARAKARGQRMLEALYAKQVLSRAEYELARIQLGELKIRAASRRPPEALHAILEIERRVRQQGEALAQAGQFVLRAGLDLPLQRQIAALARQAVREGQAKGIDNAAVIVLETADNTVRAWLGSSDYFDARRAGAMDFVTRERSPGSALKPFIYALALERGVITPATVLDDLPAGASAIVNADRRYLGPLLPRQALANSRNVPAANLLKSIGLDETYGFLRELGLHRGELPARHYGLGLSIGALPVTLADLARAYGVLAGDGRLRDLQWYAGQTRNPPRSLLSLATVRQITQFLGDPMNRLPSFPRLGDYNFPVALKTGTSQAYRDAWMVAYSTRWLVGVWLGNPQARPMSDITGASVAAELAQGILLTLHPRQRAGLEDLAFPPPPGYRPARLCAPSGKLATPACGQVFEEWFAPGTAPHDYDDYYLDAAVDTRNGLLAHSETPPEFSEKRVFLNLPPRYAEWGAGQGLLSGRFSPLQTPENIRLQIVSPEDRQRLARDPEAPLATATLALRVVAQPRVAQVLWQIDGEPFELADYPYTARWPLRPGIHTIQAHVPYTGAYSQVVRIRVE
jgi:penicillin-binding protein 1C